MFTPSSVLATGCYTPRETQAEALLRLHSALMVISVTCQTSSRGVPLVPAYTSFTRRYKGAIQAAEKVMQSHYETVESGRGLARLDELRTRLANAIGQEVARQKAPFFCAVNRDKVISVNGLDPASVEREASRTGTEAGTLEPTCAFSQK